MAILKDARGFLIATPAIDNRAAVARLAAAMQAIRNTNRK